MPSTPAFELFEVICQELATRGDTVIPADKLNTALVDDLKEHYTETVDHIAVGKGISELKGHFSLRGSPMPFNANTATGEFQIVDKPYLEFVARAASKRGVGGNDAKWFEVGIANRLSGLLTGELHRIGSPRDKHRKKKEFVRYLEGLGFDSDCLEPKDKDGGLDIVWLPPLGVVPIRPVVSLQCKNSWFDMKEGNAAVGRAQTTLNRHSHLRGHNHLNLVVFNDYIDGSYIGRAKGWVFIPLGLSDLAGAQQILTTTVL